MAASSRGNLIPNATLERLTGRNPLRPKSGPLLGSDMESSRCGGMKLGSLTLSPTAALSNSSSCDSAAEWCEEAKIVTLRFADGAPAPYGTGRQHATRCVDACCLLVPSRQVGRTSDSRLTATSSCCLGNLRRGMGTASLGVQDSGVVLLSGESGVPLPLSSGTAICGRDCACSAALRHRGNRRMRQP